MNLTDLTGDMARRILAELEALEAAEAARDAATLCKIHTGEALARLSELAQTADDPKIRSKASALLAKTVAQLREAGVDVSQLVGTPIGDVPH